MQKAPLLITSVSIILIANADNLNFSIFPPLPLAVLNTNNSLCNKESELYVQNLRNFSLWAYEMWDANAKSTSGVLRGNQFHLGNYEQCLTANSPFLTKYCLTQLQANVPKPTRHSDLLSLDHDPNEHISERLYPYEDISQQVRNAVRVGWCIPASCTSQDLENYLNEYVNELDLPLMRENVSYSAKVADLTCSTKEEDTTFGTPEICFCSLTLFFIALVIITTVVDFNHVDPIDEKPTKKSLLHRCLMGFSAKTNFSSLTKYDESNPALEVLYGIRAICIFFIIMDHRFGTYTSAAILNFDYVEKQYRGIFAPFLFHGDLFVDTFFIMGGLLVTYGLLKHLDKKALNPAFVIFSRYIRLTPAYAFVIFYYATIYNHTGSGPFWKVIAGQESQDCKDNWWTNLLYINNYVNADHICMAHSWYLPCDFHYFIIAVALCLLFKKEKKLGFLAFAALSFISVLIPFVLTVVYERPALLHFYPEFLTGPKTHPDYLLTYIKSHTRASSYFVGVFAGYIYYKLQGKDVHISRVKSYILLTISLVLMLTAIVGGAAFYNPYHKYNVIESAAYAALHRPAFDLGTVGIIFVAGYGHAGFFKAIFTWVPWVPLSKLVYGAYLFHMQFQLRYASVFLASRKFSYFDIIYLAVADIVLSFLLGLALYLLVEAPFRKIFKELLSPRRENVSKEVPNSRTTQENARNGTHDSRL